MQYGLDLASNTKNEYIEGLRMRGESLDWELGLGIGNRVWDLGMRTGNGVWDLGMRTGNGN